MGDIYRGRTALITGASSGLGAAFAAALAARGMDLVLVARRRDPMRRLAANLTEIHGGHVEVLVQDLALPGAAAAVARQLEGVTQRVDLLVNNAGFGTVGAFHKQDPARESAEVQLNVMAVLELTHAFLPAMVERGEGAVINVASVAGFQPTPFMSVYGATKAFVLSFSEALWGEYHSQGLRVLALCPGPVATEFFEATGKPDLKDRLPQRSLMDADTVVAQALRALEKNRSFVIPGRANRALAMAERLLPRQMLAAASARVLHR